MKNEILKTKLDPDTRILIGLICATGTLEFDRFPDFWNLTGFLDFFTQALSILSESYPFSDLI